MAGLAGADVEELGSLGKSMERAADRLEGLRGEISAAFERAHWGSDDDVQHFRDLWQHRLSGQLVLTASSTRTAASVLARNAQQTKASGSDNGLVPFLCTLDNGSPRHPRARHDGRLAAVAQLPPWVECAHAAGAVYKSMSES